MAGYVLIARKLLENKIIMANDRLVKLWVWLICKARYRDGDGLKRGQLFTTYETIQKALRQKKRNEKEQPTYKQVRGYLDIFKREEMITTERKSRGLLITLINYNAYQKIPSRIPEIGEKSGQKTATETNNKKEQKGQSQNRDKTPGGKAPQNDKREKGQSLPPGKGNHHGQKIDPKNGQKGQSQGENKKSNPEEIESPQRLPELIGQSPKSEKGQSPRAKQQSLPIIGNTGNNKKESMLAHTLQKSKQPKTAPPTTTEIHQAYLTLCPDLPRSEITPKLREHIKARLKAWAPCRSLGWWADYFKRVNKSDFLTGKVTGFRADLHWLSGPENMSKVLAGRYDNRPAPARRPPGARPLTFGQARSFERQQRAQHLLDRQNERSTADHGKEAHYKPSKG